MFHSCVRCDHPMEMKFAFTLTNCVGIGFILEVECAKCGLKQRFPKMLSKGVEDTIAAQEFMKKATEVSEKDLRYVG